MAWSNTHSIDLEESSSQYLSVGNDAYDITAGTVEMWVKLESLASVTGHIYGLIGTDTNSGNQGFYVIVNSSNDKISAGFGAGVNNITSTTTTTAGTFIHVAYAWDTSGAELIINGVSQASSGARTLAAGGATLYIGTQASATTRYFDGLIDDVRVYNVRRTAVQVASDIQTVLVGNESGLLSYWKLDNVLTDSTSGARTLTNTGTAIFSTTVGFPGVFTTVETAGAPVDSVSFTTSQPIIVSDTLGTPIERLNFGFGWSYPSKPSTNWTYTSK